MSARKLVLTKLRFPFVSPAEIGWMKPHVLQSTSSTSLSGLVLYKHLVILYHTFHLPLYVVLSSLLALLLLANLLLHPSFHRRQVIVFPIPLSLWLSLRFPSGSFLPRSACQRLPLFSSPALFWYILPSEVYALCSHTSFQTSLAVSFSPGKL